MGNLEPKEYERYEQIKEVLGADGLLEEIINALPNDTVLDTLEYIARMHDIPKETEEGEE